MNNDPAPTPPAEGESLEDLEIDLLLEAIHRHAGQDFRGYARVSLRRRVRGVAQEERLNSVSGLTERALHDPACMGRLLEALTVQETSLFRDPAFFLAFREKVVPFLRTYPFIRVWCAGCSTGQEAYSIAILLEEEGLYDRCRVYATDVSEAALQKAREGVFPLSEGGEDAERYLQAGGKKALSGYFTTAYGRALLNPALRRNLLFARHNLVTDASFNEFHVVLCRNVMIYFNRSLQARVHDLIHESLVRLGALCLGMRESIQLTPHEKDYEELAGKEKIYRKVR